MPDPVPAHPSATVVLLRDDNDGVELLLLRRNTQLEVHGGVWVFPGGRVDEQDRHGLAAEDAVAAARRAAVRELAEEASLDVTEDALVPMARWTTPDFMPKRFETWFFVAHGGHDQVRVDGCEIDDHRWIRPHDALAEQRALSLELPPPTFVTITRLADFTTAEDAVDAIAAQEPTIYTPKICKTDDGACSLYEGDAGYADAELDRNGARHRLWIVEGGWRYERHED